MKKISAIILHEMNDPRGLKFGRLFRSCVAQRDAFAHDWLRGAAVAEARAGQIRHRGLYALQRRG